LVAVVVGGIAAWGATLFVLDSVSDYIDDVRDRLRNIATGHGNVAGDATRYEELAELAAAAENIAGILALRDAQASQERNRLLAALNSSADAVIGVDSEGRVCFANLAAEQLFTRPREDFIGKPFAWLMPDAELVEVLKASRTENRRRVQILERPNKQYLQAIASPIVGGGDWAALLVLHDLTDVRRAELMRRDFVANVSHELRTPLASIKAVLETLDAGALSDPDAARDFIGRAQTEVDRLTQMVAELMELSRIEAGDVPIAIEPVDVGAAVSEAVARLRPQAERAGVRLSLDLDGDIPEILGDRARIERAVVNLVQNALKFTPDGGEVRVAVRDDAGVARIDVADTGVGIDERDLHRIFERFYKADNSRRTDGSGLGLALVKHTAEAHGGSVSVESRLGSGSRFTILLPAAGSSEERTAEPSGARSS
jgi:two-component system phosphate regulon sensor histidine kinase PhoR